MKCFDSPFYFDLTVASYIGGLISYLHFLDKVDNMSWFT